MLTSHAKPDCALHDWMGRSTPVNPVNGASRRGALGGTASLPAAALRAPTHLLPDRLPLLAPLKGATAESADLRGAVGMVGHAPQCGSGRRRLWRLPRTATLCAATMRRSSMHIRPLERSSQQFPLLAADRGWCRQRPTGNRPAVADHRTGALARGQRRTQLSAAAGLDQVGSGGPVLAHDQAVGAIRHLHPARDQAQIPQRVGLPLQTAQGQGIKGNNGAFVGE